MLWTLIAVAFAGVAGAGIGVGLRKLSRGRLPGGLPPVLAGVCMLIATIGQEYAWYPNNLDDLPADAVVLSERQQQAGWQPWTYIRPWVRGFIAFSPGEAVETVEGSGIYVIQAHLRERWQPEIIRPVLVDCNAIMRADVGPDTTFDDAGMPVDAVWARSDGPEDAIATPACAAIDAAS